MGTHIDVTNMVDWEGSAAFTSGTCIM